MNHGEQALTKPQYDALCPEDQGFMSYWQGSWNKAIPFSNPYRRGTEAYHLWNHGEYRATLAAQDSEA